MFCFSNALHSIIVFMMDNSFPSEEIHDSHHSQNTRPWRNSLHCYSISQKQRGPPCVYHICTRCYQSGCMLPPVWPANRHPGCLCQISCQHIPQHCSSQLTKTQWLRYFHGGRWGTEGSFSSHTAYRIWARSCSQASQERISIKNQDLYLNKPPAILNGGKKGGKH